MEVARQNGDPNRGRGAMLGVLWRTNVMPVGGSSELADPTIPAVDPNNKAIPDYSTYLETARRQRHQLAHTYLDHWNNESLAAFGYYHPTRWYNTGWMSQFGTGWRSFTCGYLNRLLDVEYPDSNLPHVIRAPVPSVNPVGPCDCESPEGNAYLERNFTFLGVSYWRELPEVSPVFLRKRLFHNPTESDSVAYAEVRVFVPRPRLEWYYVSPGSGEFHFSIGGAPGDFLDDLTSIDDSQQNPGANPTTFPGHWIIRRQPVPTHWDLLNQHWTAQLTPTTQSNLATILQTTPPLPEFAGNPIRLPNLGSVDTADIGRISPH
jgi:hypothetical protein